MENTESEIDNWLKKYATRKNFRIKEATWGSSLKVPIYDYTTEIVYKDIKHIGRGVDLSRKKAFYKSISESAERLFFFLNRSKKNTNGFSSHIKLKSSIDHSKFELFERDLICSYFYSDISFQNFNIPLDIVSKNINAELYLILKKTFTDNHFFRFRYVDNQTNEQAILLYSLYDKETAFTSSAYGNSLKKCFTKVILDNLSKQVYFEKSNLDIRSKAKVLAKKLNVILCPEGKSMTDSYLNTPEIKTTSFYSHDVLPLHYSELPFIFSISQSNDVQEIIKNPKKSDINIKRIEQLNKNITLESIKSNIRLTW